MLVRLRRAACSVAALLCAHCGSFGIELQDLPTTTDGGDANVEGGAPDAAPELDGDVVDAAMEAAPMLGEPDAEAQEAAIEDARLDDAQLDEDAQLADAEISEDAQIIDAAIVDAAIDAAVVDAGPMRCDLSGDWVAKITIATSWPPSPLLSAGVGTSSLWLRYQASASGGIVAGSLVACGLKLPDSSALPVFGAEQYQPGFADGVFDALPARIVAASASFSLSGQGFPGDIVTMSPTAFVIGTMLSDPVNAVWPANVTLSANDQDVDGQPGTTLNFASAGSYSYPRLDAIQSADQGYIAGRISFSGSVTVIACNELAGPITLPHFDTHFVGCHVAGGATCSTAQRDLLDANRPQYSAGSSSLHAFKVASGTCPTARSTLP